MDTTPIAPAELLSGLQERIAELFRPAAELEALQRRLLLTTDEAAELLGTTGAALKAMRVRGFGPAYVRHGRLAMYRPRDLQDYLAASRVRTNDAP